MDIINKIVIVGGGSSGWMTAAMLSRLYPSVLEITLIESDEIATIGVGEATIPPLQVFNNVLGINEKDFINQTQASIKLGIQFEGWGLAEDIYMHAFGDIGKNIGYTSFHHYWLADNPIKPKDLWKFSFNYQAAMSSKFEPISRIHNNQLAGLTHAYHFDAGLYAQLLHQYSIKKGVKRVEGKIVDVSLNESGNIQSVLLANGQHINGDLFIDCSGFSALLIEKTLGVEFESYQKWLKCDSAWAIPCEKTSPIKPFTRSIAHEFGWQWRIPLQHRTGNGIVFASEYVDKETAKQTLLDNLDAKPLAEPKLIRFTPGRRVKQWHKNCVAIGLASGFLEPLESTSLHLVQTAIIRLTKLMPNRQITPAAVDEYNQQSKIEFEQIRDFIILHYHLNQRDEPLWQYCQTMDIPKSLDHKINLFAQTANIFRQQEELFSQEAWLQVFIGQGLVPQDVNPLANTLSDKDRKEFLANLQAIYQHYLTPLKSHDNFLTALR
ncbi:tryptophan halogenase family protein [Shewanella inventionis]|uniref:Tryptophan halogenase n=1 Tax=Shewanella inventionis TaxID=1738770 RepID=A0ABQ1J2E1_9GAMM|nr:tryptophan halogenase family protein [Shewanella inventionis]MCL1157378.1 tryptophan 7-halogenase [Shewanella inventionis]GGB58409.1 tryptophan halogenase [Shewanella inventionis]